MPKENHSLSAFVFLRRRTPHPTLPIQLLTHIGNYRNIQFLFMASLRKKPNSCYYIACFTSATGAQCQKSTKEKNRAKALMIANKFEKAYQMKLTEAQARKVISSIYEEVRGERLFHSTLREFLASWLESKRLENSSSGWNRYKNAVDKFLTHLGTRSDDDIAYTTKPELLEFRKEVSEKHSPSTANTDLKILSIAFRQAVGDGLRLDNPCAGIKGLKVITTKTRRPFTRDELQKLLTVANREWIGMILFGVYSGQRLGDIASLRWREITGGVLNIKSGKTKRQVIVPLAAPVKRYLSGLTIGPASDPLFPHANKMKIGADGNSRRLSAEFHSLLVKAGLSKVRPKKNTGRGHSTSRKTNELSYHCLRHTATSWLKRAGASDAIAMDIGYGHTVTRSLLVSNQKPSTPPGPRLGFPFWGLPIATTAIYFSALGRPPQHSMIQNGTRRFVASRTFWPKSKKTWFQFRKPKKESASNATPKSMHHNSSIPPHIIPRLLARARTIGQEEKLCPQLGYIYLWRGQYAGWTSAFPIPGTWCPGVVAVSQGGDVYLLAGGNDCDGATEVLELHPRTGPGESFIGDSMSS